MNERNTQNNSLGKLESDLNLFQCNITNIEKEVA